MKTVLLDGVPVETTDEGAAAVVRLKAELISAVAKVSAKDGEIDAMRSRHASELAAVIAHALDADALDAAVASRIAVIDAAKSILGAEFDPSGKSEPMIRRFAAAQKMGEARLTGKDDAYVQVVFDTLVATVGDIDPARLLASTGVDVTTAIRAYDAQATAPHNNPYRPAPGPASIEKKA
ncbi:MAG: uncharacterized protein QOF70_4370 [Acetobacteraceae bacterium]|jgi:uncharacterized protein|nr:uncharacterized protein [Acetobacteraceae bacterium]